MIKKLYTNYYKTRRQLKRGTYDLLNDSNLGQFNAGNYSVDLVLRRYDDGSYVDFDVYDVSNVEPKYLDGGYICKTKKMPYSERKFWKDAKGTICNYINLCID